MYENYTRQVNDTYFDLVDQCLYHIWDDIETTPDDTTADKWKKKILDIAHKYNFSSRFALMRILYCRCTGSEQLASCSPDEGVSFTMKSGDKILKFSNVSLQHALQLEDDELEQYETALLQTAASQNYPDYDESAVRALIAKGIQSKSASQSKKKMDRQAALDLGHALGFSASEMQWFLLRVFETDDGFNVKSSDDLIEYYCFETGQNYTAVFKLKQKYAALKREHAKPSKDVDAEEADALFINWTQITAETFPEKVRNWKKSGTQSDELFLQWLLENAPCLSQPSRTALRIFRNLALYAYRIAESNGRAPEESKILSFIKKEIDKQDDGEIREQLYENGKISEDRCDEIANTLTLENALLAFTDVKDKYKAGAWRVLAVNRVGNISKPKLNLKGTLLGEIPVGKSDMLYLIWFLLNRSWTEHVSLPVIPGKRDDVLSPSEIFNRMADFIEISEYALNKALLPTFYPPHLLEQSMMLAIVSSRNNALCIPSQLYEAFCEVMTEPKPKKKKLYAPKKPPLTKAEREKKMIAAVEEYLHNPKQGLKACAEKYDISVPTLSAWKRKYLQNKNK